MVKEILPIEKLDKINKAHFVWACIIPIFLVVISNFLLVLAFAYNNPNRAYDVMSKKWNLAKNAPKSDWLVLGDSAGNQGFNNNVFDSLLNTTSLNLCTTGDMLLKDDYWLLEYYLKNHSAPKNILLIHTYDVLNRTDVPESSFNQIPIDVSMSSLKPNHKYSPHKKYLPLAYQKSSLIHLAKNPLLLFNKPYHFSDQGQQIIKSTNLKKLKRDVSSHINNLQKSQKDYLSKENRKALSNIVKLASEHNIKVHFKRAPIVDELTKDSNFMENYNAIWSDVNSLLIDQNINVLGNNHITFKVDQMESSIDHINYDASKIYTAFIVESLKTRK